MTSLKRLLNTDEEVDVRWDRANPVSQNSAYEENRFSDTPILEDPPWPDLWKGLFNSDSDTLNIHFGLSEDETANVAVWDAEESIETWAAQDLLLSQGLSAPPEATDEGISFEELTTNPSEELCYGMIYRAAVKLMGDMSEVQSKLNSEIMSQAAGHWSFGITKDTSQLYLIFRDGTRLGLLNAHTTKALDSITDLPSVQLEALVDLAALHETMCRATRASDATIRVNINVYGTREARKEVGDHLSRGKVYLQHPDQKRGASIYDNPHVLQLPGMKTSSQNLKPDGVVESASKADKAEQFKSAVTNVYASLKRSSHLKRMAGDNRLRTPLLPHQEEGLDFMMQRESGPVPPEFSLWQPIELAGKPCFRHLITKVESHLQPSETGGGVLADEMGMGKSLSILSLITKTLDDACAWKSDGTVGPSSGLSVSKLGSRATLVVVSSGLLLNNWIAEIDKHLDGTLKVKMYYGQKRETAAVIIADADIILTTYHTLAADFAAKRSPIHEIAWYRIVLDEAHIIRRRATTFYRTVFDISAKFRWCLTGSPIQNMLEDIGALFTFIRAAPFDSMATFRRYISTPFDEGEERRALASERLGLLLDSVCLRRTRELLDLPDRRDRVRVLEFSKEEREQYEWTKRVMIRAIRQRAGEVDKKRLFGMFQAQLQLRILSNHGTFQQPFSWTDRRNIQMEQEDALCSIGQSGNIQCSSCRQSLPILGTSRVYRGRFDQCAHVLCSECLDEEVSCEGGVVSRCPLCYSNEFAQAAKELDSAYPGREETRDDYFRPQGYSSKMEALIADVQEDLWGTKSIIFSCWTRTLNLITMHLGRSSIPFERIDGECQLARRQRILDDFARNSEKPVLIMTTGIGAYGLNLTAANRVFIVEPQWNPSVENQAIARAVRLGQGQSVLVTRYVVSRTVEQEMRSQQDRKLRIAEIGWEQQQCQSQPQ